MNKKAQLSIGGVLLALLAAFFGPQLVGDATSSDGAHAQGASGVDELRSSAQESPAESPPTVASPTQGASSKNASKSASKASDSSKTAENLVQHPEIGFRSRSAFDEHFKKHGAEFGTITQPEYLRLAQTLRDRPVGGDVLEIVRADGVASRFDKQSGAFLAFNKDLSLRTFFKPNDGVRYFERQADKDH